MTVWQTLGIAVGPARDAFAVSIAAALSLAFPGVLIWLRGALIGMVAGAFNLNDTTFDSHIRRP